MAGGMLSGNVVNASTQYNLNGTRLLSTGPGAGTGDLLLGANAGAALSSGINNSFYGFSAGSSSLRCSTACWIRPRVSDEEDMSAI